MWCALGRWVDESIIPNLWGEDPCGGYCPPSSEQNGEYFKEIRNRVWLMAGVLTLFLEPNQPVYGPTTRQTPASPSHQYSPPQTSNQNHISHTLISALSYLFLCHESLFLHVKPWSFFAAKSAVKRILTFNGVFNALQCFFFFFLSEFMRADSQY